MAADRFLDSIGLRHLWEKIKAWIPFLSRKTQSIPFGQVESTSTSTVFTATVDGIDELRDGVCCYLRNNIVTSASGWTLNINNLGAKSVYSSMAAATALTTQFNINYTMMFVYNSSRIEGGCWDMFFGYYSDSNSVGYDIRQYYHKKKTKDVLYRYKLLFTTFDGVLIPVNTYDRVTGTNKTLTSDPFDIFGEIYYYYYTSVINAGDYILDAYLWSQSTYTLVDLRHSFNTGTTLTAGDDVYLVCTPFKRGLVKLDEKNPIAFSLPNREDGLLYKRLGKCYDTYRIILEQHKPVYYYKDGEIREWTNAYEINVPSYTIVKLGTAETGYAASYVLRKDNVQVGATINIPKDMVVESGEVDTVTVADEPYQGAQVGDKYIDLTIANSGSQHIYIPVKDLVDVYIAGNGIEISQNNYISVKINSNQANGLGVGGDGVSLGVVTPSVNGVGGTNGAMSATDKEKLDGLASGSETPVLVEISSISAIPSATVDGLKVGDIVILNDRSRKFSYEVSFKSDTECHLTYATSEFVETVVYEKDNDSWDYVNTYTNDSKGTTVLLNGQTDSYGVFPYSLAAFSAGSAPTSMKMTSFTTTGGTGAKSPIMNARFPIGCKIYYYDESVAMTADGAFTSQKFYTSHKEVDAQYSAISGSNISLNNGVSSTVYLLVKLFQGYWTPYYKDGVDTELIVTSNQISSGNYYIYLGKTNGNYSNIFQLEDNNPLYFYDGYTLIDWSSKISENYYNTAHQEIALKANSADVYTKSEIDDIIDDISNFEYQVVNALPTASASTMGIMYLYNGHRYVTVENSGTYSWEDLGSYDIDLSGYVTTSKLDDELEDRPVFEKVTEQEMQSMIDNETWEEGKLYYTVEDT